jgi:isopentenyl phosphate kinase
VHTPAEWSGFQEVWREASTLHRILMEALSDAGLPVISFPPSAEVVTDRRSIVEWNLHPIQMALNQSLIPVVYGDVTFDRTQGGTILSTEDVFRHLADRLIPAKIFLAGVEEGIWLDFPQRTKLLPTLNLSELDQLSDSLQGSEAVDVTGGMADKVHQMSEVLKVHPQIEIHIFSGLIPGRIEAALRGEAPGTKLEADR